mmetsp:Transcript_11219/g.30198  ORF Transcript_11219/g.30198 Transcript_11219/m.30198 type:complete len:210 (-) Transcript_11219:2469-3098(-)
MLSAECGFTGGGREEPGCARRGCDRGCEKDSRGLFCHFSGRGRPGGCWHGNCGNFAHGSGRHGALEGASGSTAGSSLDAVYVGDLSRRAGHRKKQRQARGVLSQYCGKGLRVLQEIQSIPRVSQVVRHASAAPGDTDQASAGAESGHCERRANQRSGNNASPLRYSVHAAHGGNRPRKLGRGTANDRRHPLPHLNVKEDSARSDHGRVL